MSETSNTNTLSLVGQGVNLSTKLKAHVEPLMSQRVWAFSIRKIEARTATEKGQLRFWSSDYSKSSTRRISKKNQGRENRKWGQWTAARKSELTTTPKIESPITARTWLCLASKQWWRENTYQSLSRPTRRHYTTKNCSYCWKNSKRKARQPK